MNRRHFLLESASCLPCCLLPADFVRRAAAALEAGDTAAALRAPTSAGITLYAVDDSGCFRFALDSTNCEPESLTWREWAEREGIDLNNEAEFREFAIDSWLLDESDPLSKLFTDPAEKIPDDLQWRYIEGLWALSDSPQAQAHHYLRGLELGTSRSAQGESLGDLSFYEGAFPGSNFTWVETNDELVLPALQRRLLELGEDIRIEVQSL